MFDLVRVNQGSYVEVFRDEFDSPVECQEFFDSIETEQSYVDTLDTIFKDLPRQPVKLTAGVTEEEHINTWMDVGNTVSQSYAQGNIDGSFVNILFNPFVYSRRYLKEGTERTEENRHYFFSTSDPAEYAFSSAGYYIETLDKENKPIKIPCSISMFVSKRDPSVWAMAAFKNSSASPGGIEVMLISAPDIMNDSQEGLTTSKDAEARFLEFVGDETIRNMLKGDNAESGLFLPTGEVNTKRIEEIGKATTWLSDEQKERIRTKQDQLKLIKDQYVQYRNTQDGVTFAELVNALNDKEKKDRSEIANRYQLQIDERQSQIDDFKKARKARATQCTEKYQNAQKKNYGSANILGLLFLSGLVVLLITPALLAVSMPIAIGVALGSVGWLASVLLIAIFKMRKAEKNSQHDLKNIEEEFHSFCKENNELIKTQKEQISLLKERTRNEQKEISDTIKVEKKQFEKAYFDSPLLIAVCREVLFRDDLSMDDVKKHCNERFRNYRPLKRVQIPHPDSHYDPHFLKPAVNKAARQDEEEPSDDEDSQFKPN